MPLTFTTGYLEVWRDGVLLSRHREEREATEAILADAEMNPAATYEVRRPPIKVKASKVGGVINGAAWFPR